jgi:pyrimidine 5'-nucleotidase
MPAAYRTLFLDLDDTLYSQDSGVWDAISSRILGFMIERLSFSEARAQAVRNEFVERYGTTLKGLMLHHAVDPHEYMLFVHDVPIRRMIHRDGQLSGMLKALPQAKWVLTNADRAHAGRVLEALGIDSLLDGVIDFFDLSPHSKPETEAYLRAMELARAPSAAQCVLVDDQPRNLASAQRLGMTVVQVGETEEGLPGARSIARITQLPECLPGLKQTWREG